MSTTPLANLPERIDEALNQDVDEERLQRLWLGTRKRREAPKPRLARASMMLLAVLVPIFAMSGFDRRPPFLFLSDGTLPLSREVELGRPPEVLSFAEGSSIDLMPGTRLVSLRNDGLVFEMEIDRGSATFRVTPGLGRRWRVRMGRAIVEVVGTEFVVEHDEAHSRVVVRHGVVHVSSPEITGMVSLRAGDQWSVAGHLAEAPITVRTPDPQTTNLPSESGVIAPTMQPAIAHSSQSEQAVSSEWSVMAQRGNHRAAYDALGSRGIHAEAEHAEPERLALLAEVARLSGHPADAVDPLQRLLDRFPHSSLAPLAAIVLGRIEMDRLGHNSRARAAFETAQRLGIPAALRDDVRQRMERLSSDESTLPR